MNHPINNKINKLFAEKPQEKKLLSLYFCAGCPTLDGTADVILTMQRRGIAMIEVGIPFSDPLADGPVIQSAATQALKNGMNLKTLFTQLETIKDQVEIPLVLMGYLNPILHYGIEALPIGRDLSRSPEQSSLLWSRSIEAFCQSCVQAGVSGMIIPDLPFDDYLNVVKPVADRYDLRVIMLITPETSEERIRFIDDHTDGFIYMVSSAAITGAQKSFDEAKQEYFRRIDAMHLRNPRMIGFGISNAQTLKAAQDNAAGAIIGSKFVTLLNESDGDANLALDRLFDALAQ
jgi:tryptophan synthase alpha chain